ncbi:MAG TPA: hypothetical protein VGL59_09250 [Polyangia bacterium]|jgi:hypothetical protein
MSDTAAPHPDRALIWGVAITLLATALRLCWVLAVPTVPVGDFAMYRESANYLSEWGALDHGFIYMPGFVVLLAMIKDAGGDLLAQKFLGVFFGGLGAAGVFVTTLHLFDRPRAAGAPSCATAIVAGLLYALWPAGIALASVVGTDVPAAALIVVGTACLTGWGRTRPRLAALSFGVVMGLAAYVRAVALPLTALSAVYWLVVRQRPLSTLKLTALSVATTLLVLAPWAIRNRRHEGELFFTDSHGGITALIGTNPNSEGTYTRALNQLFKDVTGHSVLDEPHRMVDRQAYALAKDWARFEPTYAAGLAALRAQRLFDEERLLLYWPVYRPGVLVPPHNAFFDRHRSAIEGAANASGVFILAAFLAGLGLAASQRRWSAFVLLPFQLALAATYIVFFAEPRYRVPIEMLAFPVVAFAQVGFARLFWAAQTGARHEVTPARLALIRGALLATVLIAAVFELAPGVWATGARLRDSHRWAVTPWIVDGHTRLAKWRRADADLADGGDAVLTGAPDGVRIRPHGDGRALVDVWLAGDDLPAGDYTLENQVIGAGPERTVTFSVCPPDGACLIHHAGGPFHATVRVSSTAAVWIGEMKLTARPK